MVHTVRVVSLGLLESILKSCIKLQNYFMRKCRNWKGDAILDRIWRSLKFLGSSYQLYQGLPLWKKGAVVRIEPPHHMVP